jgi:hypothetical protein
MSQLLEVRHVSVSILRSPEAVYAFVANAENLPRWASGLGDRVQREGAEWLAEGPLGRVRIRFAPENDLGVLDHEVTLPSGDAVKNPLRVVANGGGSELTFTLFCLPGTSAERFAEDAAWVERDLKKLKALLEA